MTDYQIIHQIRLALWRGVLSEATLAESLERLSKPYDLHLVDARRPPQPISPRMEQEEAA
jgi:hypothetical protein